MFKQKLDSFVSSIQGFWGGVIIGIDGIPVEQRLVSDKINLENMATEYITLLKQSNQINIQENLGLLDEVIFSNSNIIVIMRKINSEYYFLAAFDSSMNLGMIRYKLAEFTENLSEDF